MTLGSVGAATNVTRRIHGLARANDRPVFIRLVQIIESSVRVQIRVNLFFPAQIFNVPGIGVTIDELAPETIRSDGARHTLNLNLARAVTLVLIGRDSEDAFDEEIITVGTPAVEDMEVRGCEGDERRDNGEMEWVEETHGGELESGGLKYLRARLTVKAILLERAC